jgi:sulfoxide reductase heme-binding subunit YedZ
MTTRLALLLPWTDRTGRPTLLRVAAFAAVVAPALWLVWRTASGDLGPRPVTEAIHVTGLWAVRLLLATMSVTPIRAVTGWNRLVGIRRMLGVASMAYVLLHLALYVVDQRYDLGRVASEIALRIYLTIGFVGVVGFVALGATSTDGAIRRLGGPRWNRLHGLVHLVMALAILHFLMQSKLDIGEAAWMLGLFLWGEIVRLTRRPGAVALVAVAVAAAALTAAAEAAWYGAATRVSGLDVLKSHLDLDAVLDLDALLAGVPPRPAYIVLVVCLALVPLVLFRRSASPPRGGR